MSAAMAKKLEGVYVGLLCQMTRMKAKRYKDGYWRKVESDRVLQGSGKNCSRPTLTGVRKQWKIGWIYSLFSSYA